MSIVIEKTAKKVEDAINDGLKELGVSRDDADIEILSGGGLFSKAKVRITVTGGGEESAGAAVNAENAETSGKKDKADKKKKTDKAESGKLPEEKTVKTDKKEKAKAEAEKSVESVKAGGAAAEFNPQARTAGGAGGKGGAGKDTPRHTDGGTPFAGKKREFEERDTTPVPATEKSARAKAELEKLLSLMGVSAEVTVKEYAKDMDLCADGDVGAVIGRRGETIDALQLILNHIVNDKPDGRAAGKAGGAGGADNGGTAAGDGYKRIYLDAGGYRQKRRDALAELARRTAEKVLRIGKRVSLDPMSSYERRVIHAVLAENEDIYTKSEGGEPRRRIVVYPKRKPVPAPASPAPADGK